MKKIFKQLNYIGRLNNKRRFMVFLSLIVGLLSTGCNKVDMLESISDSQFMLGTIITIQLFGSDDTSLLEGSFEIIDMVDQQMSLNLDGSELKKINEEAVKGPIEVSEEIFYVIQKALDYSDLSDGGFDISLEPVIGLWGIGSEDAKVPNPDELLEALKHVDYKKIVLDETKHTIALAEGMSLDLGGIAKGYAADLVSSYLKANGITKAIVNLGGNVLIIGEKEEGVGFKVGLQDPFKERNEYFGIVEVTDKTVVTSGVYERNFTEDGVTYHHILDTISGYPVNNSVEAISVIADASIDADALSTVFFVLGVEKGIALCETLDGVECIFVTEDRTVIMTEGAKSITRITDSEFHTE